MATSYEYDEYARLVRRNFTDTVLGDGIERYTYDATNNNGISNGTLTSMRMISGGTINYQYDGLQRMTNKDIAGEIWEAFSYSNTQVSSKINYIGNTQVHSLHYLYDSNGNITKETLSEGGALNSRTYTYDKLNQLLKVTHSTGRTENYTYDNAGNILTFNNGSGKNYTFGYGDDQWKDLLTTVTDANNKEHTITYDTIGNPITYYDGYKYTFTWTEGRRLESVEYHINDTTSCTTYYQYDNAGLRTKKLNPDNTYTVYHIADGRYVGETRYGSDNIPDLYIRYIYDENESVTGISLWYAGVSNGWDNYYFIKNLQGDVLRVYRAADNTLAAKYTYDAWGNVLSATGSLATINPFRYRGYYFDNETYFYYLQSRYYDPAIGRFINADGAYDTSQGFLGYNMFAYCGNNPVMHTDKSGCSWEDFWKNTCEWFVDVYERIISVQRQQQELDNQIMQQQIDIVSDAAKTTWDAYNYSIALENEMQYQQAVAVNNFVKDRFSTPEKISNTFGACAVGLEGAALSTRAYPKVSFGLQVGAWVCGVIAVVADFFVEE